MYKYNFDKLTLRTNSNSVKWSGCENELPMWVADMDFEVLPEIKDSLLSKVSVGVYGYTKLAEEYFPSYVKWWKEVHNVSYKKEWMIFSGGVVSALASIVRHLTNVGDQVVVQSPVYNCFYSSVIDNNRVIASSDLVYENGEYHIDFSDLEEKLSNPKTVMMILCNPHNPIGKLWPKEDLMKIAELCLKYNVLVISDEIHCDFVNPGKEYVPFISLGEKYINNVIVCHSTSKTFNLAGLQASCIVVPNDSLFEKVHKGINIDHVGSPNYFAAEASVAALSYGRKWVEELNQYIYENKEYIKNYVKENNLKLHVVPSDSTYLLWLDLSKYNIDGDSFVEDLKAKTGLYLCSGLKYGENGRSFVRMNIATQRLNIIDGMNRLNKYLKELK